MALQREFAQILQEKLGPTQDAPQGKVKKTPLKMDFPSWKYQVFTPQRTFSPSKIPPAYPRTKVKKSKPRPARKITRPTEPTFKIGQLGLEYTSDFIALQTLGADLDPSHLSLGKLKQEYRKLAKVWHPDHNSQAHSKKNFHSLTDAYKRLSQAIQVLTTQSL